MTVSKNLRVKTPYPLIKILDVSPIYFEKKLSIEKFKEIATAYPDLRMERDKNGRTTIMSPVKLGSGKREMIVGTYLGKWWLENDEKGVIFSSSTGIELADTSFKSPDCGWISEERLAQNPVEDNDGEFLKIAPDFIIEVKSQTDSLKKLKKKMSDTWMKNGVRLAWLIDPYKRKAYIYRENQERVEVINGFVGNILSGEDVLIGFELPLKKLKMIDRNRLKS